MRRSTRISRSISIVSVTPGRCTLTATRVPSGSVALYTDRCWPWRSASCRGGEQLLDRRAEPASTRGRISSHGSVGTSSCSLPSTARTGSTRSRRVASSCPILTNAGPSRSSACRMRTAAAGRARARGRSRAVSPGLPVPGHRGRCVLLEVAAPHQVEDALLPQHPGDLAVARPGAARPGWARWCHGSWTLQFACHGPCSPPGLSDLPLPARRPGASRPPRPRPGCRRPHERAAARCRPAPAGR